MSQPWERQKNESSKSFAWFCEYRDLGPARTLQKVVNKLAREQTKDDNGEKRVPIPTLTQLTNQSSKWGWTKRCQSYDNYMDERVRLQKEEDYLELEARLVAIGEDFIDNLERNLQDLKFDDAKPTTISHSLKSSADAFDKTVKDIRLLFGRSTEIKDEKVDAVVDAEIDSTAKFNVDLTSDEFMKNELEFMNKLIGDKKQ